MYPLDGTVQHYAWGTKDVIPQLLEVPETDEPFAEYWLGAHPSSPSQVFGQPLDQMISEKPAMVGQASIDRFGAKLPYLMKVLSAAQALSLQAHPSKDQAIEGFAAENAAGVPLDSPMRTYKDDWPKPEMMVALEPFDALCGFRDPLTTYQLFHELGVTDDIDMVIGPLLLRGGAAGLAEVFLDCLTMEGRRGALVTQVLAAAVNHLGADSDLGLFARTAIQLDEQYPGNPAILAALLMNRIQLQAGEAIFLHAGLMHAYLRGTGIEIMANSDNVVRGGLTSKHIDVDELIKVVDFSAAPVRVLNPVETSPGVWAYPNCTPEFSVYRFVLDGQTVTEAPRPDAGRILLVLDGELQVSVGSESLALVKGKSCFLEAGENATVTGSGHAFLTSPGV